MLILLRSDASAADRARLTSLLESLGLPFQVIESASRSAIALLGGDGRVDPARFAALSGVDEIIPLTRPYRMVAREWRPEPTVVPLPGGVSVGGGGFVGGGGGGAAITGRLFVSPVYDETRTETQPCPLAAPE